MYATFRGVPNIYGTVSFATHLAPDMLSMIPEKSENHQLWRRQNISKYKQDNGNATMYLLDTKDGAQCIGYALWQIGTSSGGGYSSGCGLADATERRQLHAVASTVARSLLVQTHSNGMSNLDGQNGSL